MCLNDNYELLAFYQYMNFDTFLQLVDSNNISKTRLELVGYCSVENDYFLDCIFFYECMNF